MEEDYIALSVYRKVGRYENKLFNDAFNVLLKDFIAILFISSSVEEISSAKTHFERILSSKSIRETESSFKANLSGRSSATIQRELYYESEEKLMLNNVIESLNNTLLGNGLVYKIFLLIRKDPYSYTIT